jgi:Zn finger protein HypA/HybF involved in hydrogenase expression
VLLGQLGIAAILRDAARGDASRTIGHPYLRDLAEHPREFCQQHPALWVQGIYVHNVGNNVSKLRRSISEFLKKQQITSVREKFMTDRIKIQCSKCRKSFGEKAQRLRTGYQMQCPHCMQLITFDSSSEDPNIRRPLKAARDFRIAAEQAVVLARMAAQAPKRDPVF